MSDRNRFGFKVSLRAEGLKDSINPFCKVSLLSYTGELQRVLYRTPTAYQTESPVWENKVSLAISFGETNRLKFEIYDNESASARVVGLVEMPCAALLNSEETQLDLIPQGTFFVTSSIDPQGSDFLYLQFSARALKDMDVVGSNDPFYVLSVVENGQPRQIYKSEVLPDTPNPRWRAKTFSVADLRGEDGEKELLVEVYDEDSLSNDYIGGKATVLSELLAPGKVLELKDKRGRASGLLCVEAGKLTNNTDFITRLRSRLQISLIFGVDFGRSVSKHHSEPGDNQFVQALRSIGAALGPYDADHRISIYGFGGHPPGASENVWDLGPGEVNGVEGVLQAYRTAVASSVISNERKTLYGLLNRVGSELEVLGQTSAYFVLVLLTDGRVEDLDQCKGLIVQLSRLPLSILLVGMGQSSLKDMAALDSDARLLEQDGQLALRDIVQFGSFARGTDARASALEVVGELPQQVSDFYLLTRR